ncbi:non-ribosomal peptide synthetase [Paenibacillus harenae]|uniref:non-ribosomal peptide synthetase n=1 Tax=Paenibacillus harenae TaxID=306543 RepID=UPI0004011C01|nr:non-ribosomal peptide synthetase [Paenibacillus harenae]
MNKANAIQKVYPLTPMQEGMLFHSIMNSKSSAYFTLMEATLSGSVDPDLFEKSLNGIMNEFDILRTVFVHQNLPRPRQVVFHERSTKLHYEDLRHLAEAEQTKYIECYNEANGSRGFQLSKDVLLRVALFRTSEHTYRLMWSHHHILMDGWGFGVVIQRLFQIYAALRTGSEIPQNIVYPYGDYIKWLENRSKEESLSYWRNALEGFEEQTSLPRRLPGGPSEEYRQGQHEFAIDPATTLLLTRMARGCGATMNSLFQAIWAVLLSKYNRTRDVVFGSVVSGRPSDVPGIEQMVGLFINTVPVRVRVSDGLTFAQLLANIQIEAIEMEAHSYLPLYEVQNQSELKQALLDHILIFENYPLGKDVEGEKAEETIGFQTQVDRVFEQTNYDLNVVVAPAEELSIKFSYNRNKFDCSFVHRAEGHLRSIIAQILDNPAIGLSELELVTAEEKLKLTEQFNATKKVYEDPKLVHALFEKQVQRTPEHTAVIGAGVELTYRELNAEANRLARTLRVKGVAGSIIAVMADPSPDMAVALLAVLKAGAAYLPIDPALPADRVRYMLEASCACCLLSDPHYVQLAESFGGTVVDISDTSGYAEDTSNLEIPVQPNDLAYIIYTSGTTGKPKGVMIEHRGIANTLLWRKEEYRFSPEDRTLVFLSYAFDAFVSTFFTPIIAGSSVLLAKASEAKEPFALKKLIAAERITHFSTVPAMFAAILDVLDREEALSLKAVTLGGEKVTEDVVNRARSVNPGLELINEYGPTENSVITTCLRHVEDGRRITIGAPIANTQVWILGNDRQLQPVGAVGELCVAGVGLARGYLNQPELMKDYFVPHPFDEGAGLLYRTGDLARWTEDGQIEFVERIDHQVKIRGYRIELGEIEAVLRKQAAIKDAAVLAVQDGSGSKQLCAYVTAEEGAEWDEASIKRILGIELPSYMNPAYYIRLERLPYTSNGKLDRKSLPVPEANTTGNREYTAPETLLEAQLQPIWEQILQVENIGVTEDFFQLGGHSLKAMLLAARLQKELQTDIPLKELFERPTIRGIARFIEGGNREEGSFAAIAPAEPKEVYPLTSAQRRMFVIHQFENVGTAYNMPDALLMEGPLDKQRLTDALQKLIDRHEPLRTSFELQGEEPVQRIHASAALELNLFYASDAVPPEQIVRDFVRPFDLTQAPLMRAGLVHLEEDRHLLLLDVHHIIADGMTIGHLIQDMGALYRGEQLPALNIQYKDYAVWQSKDANSERMKKQEAFWLDQFTGGVPVFDLPADYPRPLVRDFAGKRYEFAANEQLTASLRELAAASGSTLFMVLFAAYNVLLGKYTGQEDFVVGTPTAGRAHDELRDMTGLFVGTLALRTRPKPELAFRHYLAEVKRHCLEAFEHQDYPLEELLQQLGIPRSMSRNPLFDTMFLMQNMDSADLQLEDLRLTSYPQSNDMAKFDLTFGAIEQDESLQFSIEYAAALYRPETAERLGNHYTRLLHAIAAHPEKTIAELDVLDSSEVELLLNGFNDTAASYPHTATISSLFEQQASHHSGLIAVSDADRELTYRELNARANMLARRLREEAGVTRDNLVAILMERSTDIIVAMLAVLKAGGAYVPIDPAYPEERIQYILEDSKPKALLTQTSCLHLIHDEAGIVFDLHDSLTFTGNESDLEAVNEPHDLAYIIYTSGTTGQPKGVMITHRNVVRLLTNNRLVFDFNERDVWTMFHSYCFDFSVWEMYGALLYGGQVVVVPRHTAQNPQEFAELLRQKKVTVLNQTPTAFYALIQEELRRQDQGLTVRYVIFGGEALNPAMLRPYRDQYPDAKLINMYGITETTVHVTYKAITDREIATNVSNIGTPIPTLTCYIFDSMQKLVPIGVNGELYVGGDGVARGYLNREELSKERFVPNPYKSGERLYRTGDLVRRMANGEMEYLGRIDHQVKIRGHRIELGEIETVLIKHHKVKETTVIAREQEDGSKALCAYIVAEEEMTVIELREFTKESLPDYMVPAYFVQLDKIPLTSNGKIDRQSLPEPDLSMTIGTAYIAPESIREQLLADIWQGVLGAAHIGSSDHFFALGGDSIKAIQVAARLGAHGLKLEIKDLFQYPTIRELAQRLKAVTRSIPQGPVSGDAELTAIQHWFFKQRFTDAHHWNQSVMLYTPERFEEKAIRSAIDAIVRHHDALRFVFRPNGEGSFTAFNRGQEEEGTYTYEYMDLTGEKDDRSALARHAEQLQSSINLSAGPLFLTAHYRTISGDHLLLIAHHLIIDGVSWRILFEDLEQAYSQALIGEPIRLPLKSDSFLYWSEQLRKYADNPILLREADYWRELEERGVIPLPRDRHADRGDFQALRTAQFELDEQETDQLLKRAGRAYHTEINDLLLTALGLAVKEWSGIDQVGINLESHGREPISEALDISRTVGWFTSQYPVVLDMSAGGGSHLARQIKLTKEQLRAVPGKGIGYDLLKYMTSPQSKPALRFDLEPEICFNYLGQIDGDVTNDVFRMSDYDNGSPVSPKAENSFAWNFGGIVEDGRLSMKCHYNGLEFSEETMNRFMGAYRAQLSSVIAHCTLQEDAELTPSDISSKGMTINELEDIFDLLEDKLK